MIVGYDRKRKRMAGIGADDKNGIWICLKCLEDFKAVKCAFFVQEEIGCIGSGHADMSFFSDCRFVIQCDRKGNGDMVTQINGMRLCSNEFISAVDPRRYGYKPAQGLATDVAALKGTGWKYPASISPADIMNLIRTTSTPSWRIFASATGLSGTSSVAIRKPARIYRKRKENPSPDIMNCSERPDIAKRIISVCQKSTDLNLLKQAGQAIRTNCNLSTTLKQEIWKQQSCRPLHRYRNSRDSTR